MAFLGQNLYTFPIPSFQFVAGPAYTLRGLFEPARSRILRKTIPNL